MKIIKILLAFLLVSFVLFSCTQNGESQQAEATTTTTATEIEIPSIGSFPRIAPETITETDDPFFYESDYKMIYRRIFYRIPWEVYELAVSDRINPNPLETNEMALVSFIRHHDISRMDFGTAVQRMYERALEIGVDISEEGNELPCPDIIFTFDNEIINAFYRRENPVAPDWWPLGEADGVRTFESYSAFRAANEG